MAEKTAVEKPAVEKVIPEAEELPKAIVRRVVKEKLSQLSKDGGDISVFKEALMAFSESARIFIHYLSAMANDICKESKRQTINAEDVFKALEEMEFPDFVGPLKASLEEFRRKNAGKRSASKAKEADRKTKKIKESDAENGGEEDKQANKKKKKKKIKESDAENGGEVDKQANKKKKIKESDAENGGEEDKQANKKKKIKESDAENGGEEDKQANKKKKKIKESAVENGGEEDMQYEADTNINEDENDAPDDK